MAVPVTPLINKRLTRIINQTTTSQVEVDDALERLRLRTELDTRRRTPPAASPQSPQLSNEKEIREHFEICLKLYAENKISKKNVWKLKMIDCMLQSQNLTRNSLQVASTSLDVSARIYGLRVDSIHTDGLKIASNLARSSEQSTHVAEINDDDADRNNEPPNNLAPVAQKLPIVKNPESLLGNVPKLPSIFFQIRIDPEATPLENILSSKLCMNHGCYKYILFTKEKAWPSYGTKDPNIDFEKSYPFNISNVSNLQICAPFADFQIDEWNPDEEEAYLPSRKTNIAQIEDEVVYDSDDIPVPQLDGSIHNLFDNSGEESVRVVQPQSSRNHIAKIVGFRGNETNSGATGYSSFRKTNNRRITQAWAGPRHWKLKRAHWTKMAFSRRSNKQIKVNKKPKAKPSLINFNQVIPGFIKTNIYQKKPCQIDISPAKCTFAQVMCKTKRDFGFLMLKPVFLDSRAQSDEENEELQLHNYENPNDSQYLHQEELDNNNNESTNLRQVKEELEFTAHNVLDEHDLTVPEVVPKLYNLYASQAKKMDMKRLKIAIWKSLVRSHPDEKISGSHINEREVQKKKFSEVFEDVSEYVFRKMKEKLSYHIAFVALLDLANSHSLHLTGQSDLADFTIEQAIHE